jgi:LmbE family N-acetylglucosaminyl deacetylase
MVVAAHPDDEMLGCGGTLAKFASQGTEILVVLLGEGPTARTSEMHDDVRHHAAVSALDAAKVVGVKRVVSAGLPDNQFDTLPLLQIVQRIEKHAEEFKPDIVFTHHLGDINIDHQITHKATMTVFRPLPDKNHVRILGFEVLSSTEYNPPQSLPAFVPNVFVDISEFQEIKSRALMAYGSEMRPWPHPRSLEGAEHLAKFRGAQCGLNAAEAFILYREIC